MAEIQPPYPIFINIYNFLNTNALNNIGLGIYHSAIEILNIEFAFGGHPYEETGIYTSKPRNHIIGKFIKQIHLEHTYFSKEQICDILLEAAIKYRGNAYDIIRFNCNDFTDDIAMSLCGTHIPNFINRAAKIGRIFRKKLNNDDDLEKIAYQEELQSVDIIEKFKNNIPTKRRDIED